MTALYAVRLRPDAGPRSHLARVTVRWTDPDRGGAADLGRDVALNDLSGSFGATDPHFRMDAIVAQTAEVLRGSEFAGQTDIRDVADVANREDVNLPPTDEVHAFLDMLADLGRLRD